MKVEVGMYVRFKDKRGATYIRKLTKLADKYPQKLYGMEIDEEANYSPYLGLKNILKASYNIIDLIQVGDYVNGYKIERVDEPCELNPYGSLKYRQNEKCDYEDILGNEIKTIVTKEQFESMSYKVEG